MTRARDQLVLIPAFVVAVGLHAALLPWVGQAVGRSVSSPAGDLRVEALQAPGSASAGEAVAVSCVVRYESAEGMAGQLPRRVDRLWLSLDRSIDDSDTLLGERPNTAMTAIARTQPITLKVELPADADGPYWLIAQADGDEAVPDRNRANNLALRPIYIDGSQTPELAIEQFNAPEQATPGGAILIDYAIKNIGDGWAANAQTLQKQAQSTHWTDRVYLSLDNKLDPADVPLRGFDRTTPLAPGAGYRHERVELAIPRGVSGPMFLIAVADADQVLDQPSFTAGLVVRPITLIETGAPDLIVAAVTTPPRLVHNRPGKVTIAIANLGSTPTADADWMDGLYLAPEPVLDERAMPLAKRVAHEVLGPRERYTTTIQLTLAESVELGSWYLIAKADVDNAIDERGFDDNNALAVPVRVLTEAQADAEIQLGDPDRPERLVVQWIEHERLEEHRARLSRTTQPAIQDRADPVPEAPLNFEPLPPTVSNPETPAAPTGSPNNPAQPDASNTQPDTAPTPSAADAAQSDVAPRPQQPGTRPPERVVGLPGNEGDTNPLRPGINRPTPPTPSQPNDPTPGQGETPSPEPGDRKVTSPASPDVPNTDRTTDSDTPAETDSDTDANNPNETQTTQPAERTEDSDAEDPSDNPETSDPSERDGEGDANDPKPNPEAPTTENHAEEQPQQPEGEPADPAQPSEEQDPTRVPRDPSEVPPVSIQKIEVALQEGRVLVGKGIKVTTKLPTPPGTGVRRFTLPRNARIRITFNPDGSVHEAKLLRSTTSAAWDAAIEASLYRWSARGEAVESANPRIAIEWDYILNELLGDE